jgi:hypothetical protein
MLSLGGNARSTGDLNGAIDAILHALRLMAHCD